MNVVAVVVWLLLLTNHLLGDRAAKESLQASVGVCHWLCERRHGIDMCVCGECERELEGMKETRDKWKTKKGRESEGYIAKVE